MSIDLSGYHKGKRPQKTSVAALGGDEWNKVLDHLLALDPAVGAVKPKAGRYDLAYRVRKREAAVNLMLLQATTGLRVDEASQVTWSLLQVDDDGQGHVVVTPDITKGKKKGRTIPILDDRVVQRLLKKRKAASDPKQGWVIASPFDETKRWNSKDRNTATRDLCLELAAKLELKLFEVERTHFWRATLNSLLDGSVPEAVRAAYFGHTTRVNRESYTDVYDVTEMKEAAKLLRKDPQPTAG